MKSERRHELQHNELADRLGLWMDRVRPYARHALIVGTVLLLAGVASFYFRQQSAQRRVEAWDQYFAAVNARTDQALLNVAQNYPGTEAAHWALILLADNNLTAGTNALFEDRAAARERLRQAIDRYQLVRDETPAGSMLQQRAVFGLARAHEGLNELEKAREEYSALAQLDSSGIYTDLARERLHDLERQPTRAFYDWFAAQNPQPKPAPGSQFNQPDFKFESLPDEPLFQPSNPLDSSSSSSEPALPVPNVDESLPADGDAGSSPDPATPNAPTP